MPSRSFVLDRVTAADVEPALAALRTELEVPGEFSAEALAEAERAAAAPPRHDLDATDVELVTVDPPGSRDLDQALYLSRQGEGYLVQYAIADPASFITPGGALDTEVHERGLTFYGPDGRIGLHPAALAEGAASLLPEQARPACVWRIELDASGEIVEAGVRRAMVRSRAQLTYEQVQAALDGDEGGEGGDHAAVPAMLELLREIGTLRQEREIERGGASLRIPEQEVVRVGDHYELRYRATLDVEEWNAQISLLTGIAAAGLMRRKRMGVFRTLPEADPRDVKRLRHAARGLGVAWEQGEAYGAMLRRLDASVPAHAAFLDAATTLFRGAGYLTFDGDLPPASPHGAIASEYAHVTAPLRRLVDRYGQEICLAATAGTDVPDWVRAGLEQLPQQMASAGHRANGYERECVNLLEALVLASRVGESFDGVVVEVNEPKGDATQQRGTVVVAEPAVQATVLGPALPLGEATAVTLTEADPTTRTVAFSHP
ncbi:RNB domain-containing ribonuclease [Pseudactinotalea suaedae]|uniref:RNB domain-containing ribonuclease n=1 Tax=Pseudactinotalea suaedae TaxID=1524924 RepID=UPI0012E10CDA|nr:RNB domain-containing ribonuclease [Pseudactinotalea suaedae]